MGTRLYVGNLDYGVDDAGLYELFSSFGQVNSAQVMTDRDTGQAKGFGFVEMASEEDAQKGIQEANGMEHSGRVLTVNEARPKEDSGSSFGRGRGGGFGGGGGGDDSRPPSRWLNRLAQNAGTADGYRVESDGYVSSRLKSAPPRNSGGKKRGRRR